MRYCKDDYVVWDWLSLGQTSSSPEPKVHSPLVLVFSTVDVGSAIYP